MKVEDLGLRGVCGFRGLASIRLRGRDLGWRGPGCKLFYFSVLDE